MNTYATILQHNREADNSIPEAYPVTEETMRYFFFTLQIKLPPTPFSTISTTVSAFANYFIESHLPDLTKQLEFRQYILYMKKTHHSAFFPNSKKYVPYYILCQLIDQSDFYDEQVSKDMAILTLMYFGFLRVSEICHLRIHDIEYTDEYWAIQIRASKTDKFGHGTIIYIYRNTTIYSCFYWLLMFIPIGVNQEETGKCFETIPAEVKKMIRRRLRAIHIVDINKYGAHSFRKGGAHFASERGVPDSVIKTHGRWKSHCFELYTCVERKNSGKLISQLT
jgi:integrase